MKILFVSALMPYPLYSGGQVRVFNLLSRLGKTHDITLVTFLRNNQEKHYETNLPFCKKVITGYRGHAWRPGYVLRSLVSTKPLLLTSYDLADLRMAISNELIQGNYDLIHIEPWYVWPSLPATTVPTVVVTHNIEYEVYTDYVRRIRLVPLRPGYFWDVVKLACWEKRVWKLADHIVSVSQNDASIIRKSVPAGVPVSIVPNGVDISSFHFEMKKNREAPTVLFVGSFSWMQNRDAASWLLQSIWPAVRNRYPRALLRIVGRSIPASFQKLGADNGVVFLEHVENIEEEFHSAHLLLAPMRIAGGTSFKILEAMASGLPVITTTLGAAGLNVSHGKELIIGNSQEEFVDAVSMLLASSKRRSGIARSARITIEREYSWDTIAKAMDRVWYETAKKRT